jgi:adenosylcobinamide-GDP ribazoletransferase
MVRAVLSLLTKLPVGSELYDIKSAAKYVYIFPIVGVLIGTIVFIFALMLFNWLYIDLAAFLTVLILYATTGLIHLDGLADFADGLMAHGNSEHKLRVMKDPNVGIAGTFIVIVTLILLFISIRELAIRSLSSSVLSASPLPISHLKVLQYIPMYNLFSGLILAEVSAKLSMISSIYFTRKYYASTISSSRSEPQGLGSVFIELTTGSKYIISIAVATGISVLLFYTSALLILIGICVGIALVPVGIINFGKVTGDVLGASNELARMITLLVAIIIGL